MITGVPKQNENKVDGHIAINSSPLRRSEVIHNEALIELLDVVAAIMLEVDIEKEVPKSDQSKS